MSDFVQDASVALKWFLEDESGREYSLAVLSFLSRRRALVPELWFYEVGNGLLVAARRKRITLDQMDNYLENARTLPIDLAHQIAAEVLALPAIAPARGLTNYDAAYLALAMRAHLPLATSDEHLRRVAESAGIGILRTT